MENSLLGPPASVDRRKESTGAAVCHRCDRIIDDLEAFIRVGDFKFHKQHFQCFECGITLQGQKFHNQSGKFYCSKDYNNKFVHQCNGCGERIRSGKVVTALNGTYHPACFVCTTCKLPFDKGKYFNVSNKPYCETHFLELRGDRCKSCGEPVKEEDKRRVRNSIFHAHCLKCYVCGLPMVGEEKLFEKDGNYYCQNDFYEFFGKRCSSCGDFIQKTCVSANNETYHRECLKCSICSKQMDSYLNLRGYLRCQAHSKDPTPDIACTVCKQVIERNDARRIVCSAAHKCHEECFKCTFCNKKLEKQKAKLFGSDKKLCCLDCLMVKKKDVLPPPVHLGLKPITHQRTNSAAAAPIGNSSSGSNSMSNNKKLPKKPPKLDKPTSSHTKGAASWGGSENRERIDWKKGSLIGTGAFGKVYMAMNNKTAEIIAVKQVTFNDNEIDTMKQLRMEIDLMRTLEHENIVRFYEVQEEGKKLNILMEYVAGSSLDAILGKFGPLDEKVIRYYTRQLCKALEYVHSKSITHRDIKGKNVLVDTNGVLKLADFGSAKELFESKVQPSLNYSYTPLWTAPEVLQGNYDTKIDVWSMGCVIIEMATGDQPWAEQNFENPFRALYHIGNSDKIPKFPEGLSILGQDFLSKCLCRDPTKRWNASQLLKHQWLQEDEEVDNSQRRTFNVNVTPPSK